MLNLLSEPTSWLLLAAVEVEEGLDKIFAGRMTSSVSVNRTPHAHLACMWMTLWPQSLKTLQPLLDFCPLNGLPRVPQNLPLEGFSPATGAEPPSTARLVSSLHHSLKGFSCLVRDTATHAYIKKHMVVST